MLPEELTPEETLSGMFWEEEICVPARPDAGLEGKERGEGAAILPPFRVNTWFVRPDRARLDHRRACSHLELRNFPAAMHEEFAPAASTYFRTRNSGR